MKNVVEIVYNGNKIVKRNTFGYDVFILKSDGGFRKSDNSPFDYLGNARSHAKSETPLHLHVKSAKNDIPLMENLADNIRELRKLKNIVTNTLKNNYLPMMEKCTTKEDLSILIQEIKRSLGFECGESFPGEFEVDVIFQFHIIINDGGKDA